MIMKKYVFLHLLFGIQAARPSEKFCDVSLEDAMKRCYVKEVIINMTHSPNQMAVDRSNHLYFSYDAGQGEYIPMKIILKNNTRAILKGVKDAFAIAHESLTGELYFGGSHGIYRYNPEQKSLKRLAINDLDIWWIVAKKSLYYIKFPSLKAYRYENRTQTYMRQLQNHVVQQFAFDIDDNIFFINNTGLFGIKHGENDAVLLREYPRFLGMATDNEGYVFLCSEEGIFTISRMIPKVKRVVQIHGVLGLTFDKDNNIIYSDSHEIVRLVEVSRENYYKSVGWLV